LELKLITKLNTNPNQIYTENADFNSVPCILKLTYDKQGQTANSQAKTQLCSRYSAAKVGCLLNLGLLKNHILVGWLTVAKKTTIGCRIHRCDSYPKWLHFTTFDLIADGCKNHPSVAILKVCNSQSWMVAILIHRLDQPA